ncbi:hypothetical protein [Candidatus Magnetobacterium casense]|uniref:hypothetical protein n=1 Tax=Candidatus Magnetobacterium casense TaxID=1455061 RepID=UPI00058DD7EF|nr:hypothetical protein [Candidatus Magnetobacterium casensis]
MTDDIDGVIRTIVSRLSGLSPEDAKDYVFKLLGLSNLNKIYNKVKKEVENMPITFDIRESEMFLDGKQEGLLEGLLEGERKGLLEGERKGLLEGIEMALEIKYGYTGIGLMGMIRNIGTLEELSQLKVIIKRSDTIDEVKASLIGMIK